MDSTKRPLLKNTRVLMVIGIVVIVVLVVAIIVAAAMNNSKKDNTPSATVAQEQAATSSNDEVRESIAVLDAAMKQSDADRAAAKAALQNDGYTKVSD